MKYYVEGKGFSDISDADKGRFLSLYPKAIPEQSIPKDSYYVEGKGYTEVSLRDKDRFTRLYPDAQLANPLMPKIVRETSTVPIQQQSTDNKPHPKIVDGHYEISKPKQIPVRGDIRNAFEGKVVTPIPADIPQQAISKQGRPIFDIAPITPEYKQQRTAEIAQNNFNTKLQGLKDQQLNQSMKAAELRTNPEFATDRDIRYRVNNLEYNSAKTGEMITDLETGMDKWERAAYDTGKQIKDSSILKTYPVEAVTGLVDIAVATAKLEAYLLNKPVPKWMNTVDNISRGLKGGMSENVSPLIQITQGVANSLPMMIPYVGFKGAFAKIGLATKDAVFMSRLLGTVTTQATITNQLMSEDIKNGTLTPRKVMSNSISGGVQALLETGFTISELDTIAKLAKAGKTEATKNYIQKIVNRTLTPQLEKVLALNSIQEAGEEYSQGKADMYTQHFVAGVPLPSKEQQMQDDIMNLAGGLLGGVIIGGVGSSLQIRQNAKIHNYLNKSKTPIAQTIKTAKDLTEQGKYDEARAVLNAVEEHTIPNNIEQQAIDLNKQALDIATHAETIVQSANAIEEQKSIYQSAEIDPNNHSPQEIELMNKWNDLHQKALEAKKANDPKASQYIAEAQAVSNQLEALFTQGVANEKAAAETVSELPPSPQGQVQQEGVVNEQDVQPEVAAVPQAETVKEAQRPVENNVPEARKEVKVKPKATEQDRINAKVRQLANYVNDGLDMSPAEEKFVDEHRAEIDIEINKIKQDKELLENLKKTNPIAYAFRKFTAAINSKKGGKVYPHLIEKMEKLKRLLPIRIGGLTIDTVTSFADDKEANLRIYYSDDKYMNALSINEEDIAGKTDAEIHDTIDKIARRIGNPEYQEPATPEEVKVKKAEKPKTYSISTRKGREESPNAKPIMQDTHPKLDLFVHRDGYDNGQKVTYGDWNISSNVTGGRVSTAKTLKEAKALAEKKLSELIAKVGTEEKAVAYIKENADNENAYRNGKKTHDQYHADHEAINKKYTQPANKPAPTVAPKTEAKAPVAEKVAEVKTVEEWKDEIGLTKEQAFEISLDIERIDKMSRGRDGLLHIDFIPSKNKINSMTMDGYGNFVKGNVTRDEFDEIIDNQPIKNTENGLVKNNKNKEVTVTNSTAITDEQAKQNNKTLISQKLITSQGGDIWLTEESDIDAIEKVDPRMSVYVKDVNGQRAVFSIGEFNRLRKNPDFSDRIRETILRPYQTERGFKGDTFMDIPVGEFGKNYLENKTEKKREVVEKINGIDIVENASVSDLYYDKFVSALNNKQVRELLQQLGITRIEIEKPYKMEFAEGGHIILKEHLIRINASNDNPLQTLKHELGHVVWDSLTDKQKSKAKGMIIVEGIAKNGYAKLKEYDEAFADNYFTEKVLSDTFPLPTTTPTVKPVQKKTKQAKTETYTIAKATGEKDDKVHRLFSQVAVDGKQIDIDGQGEVEFFIYKKEKEKSWSKPEYIISEKRTGVHFATGTNRQEAVNNAIERLKWLRYFTDNHDMFIDELNNNTDNKYKKTKAPTDAQRLEYLKSKVDESKQKAETDRKEQEAYQRRYGGSLGKQELVYEQHNRHLLERISELENRIKSEQPIQKKTVTEETQKTIPKDRQVSSTIIEYAKQELFKDKWKGKSDSAISFVVKKFHGSTNMFIENGKKIDITKEQLKDAVYKDIAQDFLKADKAYQGDKFLKTTATQFNVDYETLKSYIETATTKPKTVTEAGVTISADKQLTALSKQKGEKQTLLDYKLLPELAKNPNSKILKQEIADTKAEIDQIDSQMEALKNNLRYKDVLGLLKSKGKSIKSVTKAFIKVIPRNMLKKVSYAKNSAFIDLNNGLSIVINLQNGVIEYTKAGRIEYHPATNILALVDIAKSYNSGNKVAYHEAGHLAFDMFLSQAQRDTLTAKYGTEEKAMDAFAEYMAKRNTVSGTIQRVFNYLKAKLRQLWTNSVSPEYSTQQEQIFASMAKGKYDNSQATVNPATKYKTVLSDYQKKILDVMRQSEADVIKQGQRAKIAYNETEKKLSTLGISIGEEFKLAYGETKKYTPKQVDEMTKVAENIIADIDRARAILRDESSLPDGLPEGAFVRAMKRYLRGNPENKGAIAIELANSNLIEDISKQAQSMRLSQDEETNPIKQAVKTIKEANQNLEKRNERLTKATEKLKAEYKKGIETKINSRNTKDIWSKFVKKLECP
jgi:hypothetical protein